MGWLAIEAARIWPALRVVAIGGGFEDVEIAPAGLLTFDVGRRRDGGR